MGTTVPVMGHDEAFGLAVENTAYGTPATPDVWFRPVSNTYKAMPRVGPLQGPSGKMVPLRYISATAVRHFTDVPDRSGTVVLECEYDDIGWILANVFGNPNTVDGTVNSATHTFTLPDATPSAMPGSLTTARVTGLEQHQLAGGMINTWTLRGQSGQYITQSCDFIGSVGGQAHVADVVGTLSSAPWMEFYHSKISISSDLDVGNLVDLDGGEDVSEWTLTMNNNLLVEEAAGAATWGIRPPVWNDFRTCELAFSHRWVSDTVFDLIHPATESARYRYVRLTIDSGVATGGDAGDWSMTVDFPAGVFLGDVTDYAGGGSALVENVRIQAGSISTTAPVTITLINNTQELLGTPLLYAYGEDPN